MVMLSSEARLAQEAAIAEKARQYGEIRQYQEPSLKQQLQAWKEFTPAEEKLGDTLSVASTIIPAIGTYKAGMAGMKIVPNLGRQILAELGTRGLAEYGEQKLADYINNNNVNRALMLQDAYNVIKGLARLR